MSAVITFHPDGTAAGLYTELIPLAEIGSLEIRRASTIEFNNATQQWDARLACAPATVAFSHPSRLACLEWERRTLQSINPKEP